MGEVYFGDNLEVLRSRIADGSVDLVYLDPPFKSDQDYHVLPGVAPSALGRAPAPVRAFGDTWAWDDRAEANFAALEKIDGRVFGAMRALRELAGAGGLLAYLTMMAPRLVELRRALKPSGSIYLHCDPTASHYLKVLMDAVLGPECFRNEVIWRYRRWPAKSRQFQKMHDVLLFYTKSPGGGHCFNTLYGYEELAASTKKTFGTRRQVADFSSGHRKPGKKDEESPGPPLSDVWDVGIVAPSGHERLGYPTQKPEALLSRIVLASSREGDLVLDPFCGSGTSIVVAERLGRRWIGIDAAYLAIWLVKQRLHGTFGGRARIEVVGEPRSLEEALALLRRDPEQFRSWALGLAGALGEGGRRGAVKRGVLVFSEHADAGEEPASGRILVWVNTILNSEPNAIGGEVRELRASMDKEGAAMGALVTLDTPSTEARREAEAAGKFMFGRAGTAHPKVQIVTVAELLAGRRVDVPGAKDDQGAPPPSPRLTE
jgi:site-specific DNA-methyltransferase (adenine-specific)